jgi:SAM-dependent methyltransferase
VTVSRTQSFFERYAVDFDSLYGNASGPLQRVINQTFRKSMWLRYEKSLEGCVPIEGMSVLDVGCGPGHYGVSLAQAGAASVLGLDFSEDMLRLAAERARLAGVAERCKFVSADFMKFQNDAQFDYVIVMGFMDYMADPAAVVAKVLSLARRRAFFSFPVAGGLLAWQRKLRYASRCELYMYTREQLGALFGGFRDFDTHVEPIARDFFVTAERRR